MKNKIILINLSLMVAVLFAMLFQSLHGYEHIIKDHSTPKCHLKHLTSQNQITHEHNSIEHCFACEFTFSNYKSAEIQIVSFVASLPCFKSTFYYVKRLHSFYNGISYSLRGPPFFKI